MTPSFWQIVIVVVLALLFIGPKRIPGLGKSLGEAIKGFRKGIKDDSDTEESPDTQDNSSQKLADKTNNPSPKKEK